MAATVLNFRAGQARLRNHSQVAQSNARLQDRLTESLRPQSVSLTEEELKASLTWFDEDPTTA